MNPIYGSVGLLGSGTWSLCHNAVEAVLNGAPITPIASDSAECNNGPPLKAYDIRHVSKEENSSGSKDLHRVRTRCRFKKSAAKPRATTRHLCDGESGHDELNRSTSHDSSLSHQSEAFNGEGESREVASIVSRVGKPNEAADEDGEVELDLTLGLEPVSRSHGLKGKTTELGFE